MISVKEAREILGDDASDMTDDEIEFVIKTLDLMATDALKISTEEVYRTRDALKMTELIYDIYQDKKKSDRA